MNMNASHTVEADNASMLFIRALDAIVSEGYDVEVRGLQTVELLFPRLRLVHPQFRWLHVPERKMNTFASCVETLWVLSGGHHIDTILPVLPRAADFSDDGLTWRAAYGHRLFNFSSAGINQLDYCLNSLRKDSSCRQAVATIWDPLADCTVGRSKDFPCSNHLQFLVREEPDSGNPQLHFRLVIRSNDLIWGASAINIIEFSIIQELMAGFLGVSVGEYFHDPGSLHIYPANLKFDPRELIARYGGQEDLFYSTNCHFPNYGGGNDQEIYRELGSFEELNKVTWRFLEAWKSRDTGYAEEVIFDLPGVLRGLAYAALAWWAPDRKNNKWIDQIEDLGLKASLKMSWTPKN